MKIREALQRRDNDYTFLEKKFINVGDLVSPELSSSQVTEKSASVIIPVYNLADRVQLCLNALSKQTFSKHNCLEVIVVDDCSSDGVFEQLNLDLGITIRYYRTRQNYGYGIPRNIGLLLSTSDIIIFMDSDMVAPPEFISEQVIRHSLLDNILLVGFKENISIDNQRIYQGRADYKQDPRFYKDTSKYGKQSKILNIFEETHQFKNFGHALVLHEDSLPTGWTLPMMVITHNLSLHRKHAMASGAFDISLSKHWGYEDTFFGAKLIANGLYVVPSISAPCFHLNHPARKTVTKEEKMRGMEVNREVYLSKLEDNVRVLTPNEFYEQNKHYLQMIDEC